MRRVRMLILGIIGSIETGKLTNFPSSYGWGKIQNLSRMLSGLRQGDSPAHKVQPNYICVSSCWLTLIETRPLFSFTNFGTSFTRYSRREDADRGMKRSNFSRVFCSFLTTMESQFFTPPLEKQFGLLVNYRDVRKIGVKFTVCLTGQGK